MEDKENSADGEVQDQDEDPETDDTDWDVSEPKVFYSCIFAKFTFAV